MESVKKRLFIAVFPPTEIVTRLQATVAELAEGLPVRAVRWTQADQIHLTLFFLGNVEVSRISVVQSAVAAACQENHPFEARAIGLGCFPSPARPRILWAGLSSEDNSLQRLKQSIDSRLLAIGFADEDRPFHPHLTLGRVTELNSAGREKIAAVLEKVRILDFGRWQIDRVELMESILGPRGSKYAILHSVPLNP